MFNVETSLKWFLDDWLWGLLKENKLSNNWYINQK